MKHSQYFLPTTREAPAEASLASHLLMLRSGLIRKVGAGLYSYMPAGLKALKKVEEIVRQEMNRSGALEVSMPLLIPRALLDKTGRWEAFEKELYTLQDRGENFYCLSPTNEENFSSLAEKELLSYKQFPINLYQINTKFRDEIRPRYGVMRAREFVMKDAYSFHLTDECLDKTYEEMRKAYLNAFARMELDIVSVKADSGNMGGSASEEFMVPSEVGEETIIYCDHCKYTANSETASEKITPYHGHDKPSASVEKIKTPGATTIEKLCAQLNIPFESTIKTLVYQSPLKNADSAESETAIVLLRGDYQLNETKMALTFPNYKAAEEKSIVEIFQCKPGYISPYGLSEDLLKNKKIRIVADESLRGGKNMVAGANSEGYHIKGIDVDYFEKAFSSFSFLDLHLAKKGGQCTSCGKTLDSFKGIEVGHIFKLGQRYAKAFNCKVTNDQGQSVTPTMGCYGIGISRCLAAIIEKHHDQSGIVFPLSTSPFQVALISLGDDEEVLSASKSLYEKLLSTGIDVLWDDRDVRPGVKFQDQDLLGCSYQVICSSRNLAKKTFELKNRRTAEREMISVNDIAKKIEELCR